MVQAYTQPGDKVIGGDVCSVELDGFMQGLEQPDFSQDDGGSSGEEEAASQEG